MIFQLIVWAPTRERAIARMKRALDDTIITGKSVRPTLSDVFFYLLNLENRIGAVFLEVGHLLLSCLCMLESN